MEVIYRCNKCDDFESSDINIAVVHRCASKLEVPPANGEQQLKSEIAALATEIESCLGRIPRGDKVFSLIAKMRQLSAV